MTRVVVGMSGGVDSSVAALLLKQKGYDVVGLYMTNWEEPDENGCCHAEEDYADVKSVCARLEIPYFTVNFAKEYMERVFKTFVEEYKKGRTPNPDVLCNREIKFGPFADYAKKLGADFVATGHYCNIIKRNGKTFLAKAADQNKDQTYFLNSIRKANRNVMFPLGDLIKDEVRQIASVYGLSTAEKKDSTGICFIGERNFKNFLSGYIPMKRGNICTLDGKVVGEHNGVFYYTVGQRRGLGIGGTAESNGDAWFVLKKDVANNVLYVSQGEDNVLFKNELVTEGFNFISGQPESNEFRCTARIRHRQPEQDATAIIEDGGLRLIFDKPQRAVVEGQYAVIYVGQICLGGGVISAKGL